jgi:malate dehydrogenase (oxaloacetate-decarboxylating)(NADP+)
MFLAAAQALGGEVSDADLAVGSIYPPLADIRSLSLTIAVAVAEVAYAQGLARRPRPANLKTAIADSMYDPTY